MGEKSLVPRGIEPASVLRLAFQSDLENFVLGEVFDTQRCAYLVSLVIQTAAFQLQGWELCLFREKTEFYRFYISVEGQMFVARVNVYVLRIVSVDEILCCYCDFVLLL